MLSSVLALASNYESESSPRAGLHGLTIFSKQEELDFNQRIEILRTQGASEEEIDFVSSLYKDGLLEAYSILTSFACSWFVNFVNGVKFTIKDVETIESACRNLEEKFFASRWSSMNEKDFEPFLETINAFRKITINNSDSSTEDLTSEDILFSVELSLFMLEVLPTLLPVQDKIKTLFSSVALLSLMGTKSKVNPILMTEILESYPDLFSEEIHLYNVQGLNQLAHEVGQLAFSAFVAILSPESKPSWEGFKRGINRIYETEDSILSGIAHRPVLHIAVHFPLTFQKLENEEGDHIRFLLNEEKGILQHFLHPPEERGNVFSGSVDLGFSRHADAFHDRSNLIPPYIKILDEIKSKEDEVVCDQVRYALINPLFYEKTDSGFSPLDRVIQFIKDKKLSCAKALIINFEELYASGKYEEIISNFLGIKVHEQLQINAQLKMLRENSEILDLVWRKISEFKILDKADLLKLFISCQIPADLAKPDFPNSKSIFNFLNRHQPANDSTVPFDGSNHKLKAQQTNKDYPKKLRPLLKLSEKFEIPPQELELALSNRDLESGFSILLNDITLRTKFFEALRTDFNRTVEQFAFVTGINSGNIYSNLRDWLLSNSSIEPTEEASVAYESNARTNHELLTRISSEVISSLQRVIILSGSFRDNPSKVSRVKQSGQSCFEVDCIVAPLDGILPEVIRNSGNNTLIIVDIGAIRHSQFNQLRDLDRSKYNIVYMGSGETRLKQFLRALVLKKYSGVLN